MLAPFLLLHRNEAVAAKETFALAMFARNLNRTRAFIQAMQRD